MTAAQPIKTAQDLAAEKVAEWGRYVAAYPIDFYGTRAFNPGDPVPVSAVQGDDAWIPETLVTDVRSGDTETPTSLTSPPPTPPTVDEAATAAPAVSSPVVVLTDDGPVEAPTGPAASTPATTSADTPTTTEG